jgi:alpha/beta superfamily hydrolase
MEIAGKEHAAVAEALNEAGICHPHSIQGHVADQDVQAFVQALRKQGYVI